MANLNSNAQQPLLLFASTDFYQLINSKTKSIHFIKRLQGDIFGFQQVFGVSAGSWRGFVVKSVCFWWFFLVFCCSWFVVSNGFVVCEWLWVFSGFWGFLVGPSVVFVVPGVVLVIPVFSVFCGANCQKTVIFLLKLEFCGVFLSLNLSELKDPSFLWLPLICF